MLSQFLSHPFRTLAAFNISQTSAHSSCLFNIDAHVHSSGQLTGNQSSFFRKIIFAGTLLIGSAAGAHATCSGFSATQTGTGFFTVGGPVTSSPGSSINVSVTAAGGVTTEVYYLASSATISGTGTATIAGPSSGTASGNVDAQTTGGSATVSATCTPGSSSSSSSSGGSASSTDSEGVDDHLSTAFPHIQDGDLVGELGIPEPDFDDGYSIVEVEDETEGDEEEQTEEDGSGEDEEEETAGTGCSSCQSRLNSLINQMLRVRGKISDLSQLKGQYRSASGDHSFLVSKQLNISKFKNEHARYADFEKALAMRSNAREALSRWIASGNNQEIAASMGLTQGATGPGGIGQYQSDYFTQAFVNFEHALGGARADFDLAKLESDQATMDALIVALETGLELGTAGSSSKFAQGVEFVQDIRDLADTITELGDFIADPDIETAADKILSEINPYNDVMETLQDYLERAQSFVDHEGKFRVAEAKRRLLNEIIRGYKLTRQAVIAQGLASTLDSLITRDAEAQQKAAIDQEIEKIDAEQASLERDLSSLNRSVTAQRAECARLCTVASAGTTSSAAPRSYATNHNIQNHAPNHAPSHSQSVAMTAYAIVNEPQSSQASKAISGILVSENSISGAFDLRQHRKIKGYGYGTSQDLPDFINDPRFNMFAQASVTFNRSSTGGQEGTSISVSGGASWKVRPKINIGLALAYAHSDLSNATSSKNSATWSVAAFAQTQLPQKINLEAAASIGYSNINSLNGTTSANANAHALSFQLKASKPFDLSLATLTPSASISYAHTYRYAFTASNGSQNAARDSDHLTYNLGMSIAAKDQFELGAFEVTPSLNVATFGSLSNSGTLGYSVGGGFSIKSAGAASGNIGFGYSNPGGGSSSFSINGSLKIPFGS